MDLAFYTNFATSLVAQENQLNTLEQEVATGVAVQTPDQNPSAWETAAIGTDQLNTLNSESTSLADIQGQIGNVSDVYSSVSTLLDSVQSAVEQALNGTTSSANMQSIATQVGASEQQLLGLGNTTGTNGTYLFGGTRGNVQPFQTQADGSVTYMGDGGTSQAAISSDLTASTIANGEAFMTGMQGDGYASVTATSSNTGSGILLPDGVTSPTAAAAFQASGQSGAVTVAFSGSGSDLSYTTSTTSAGGVTTTSSPVTVTSGSPLTIDGMEFQLSGTPTSGDSFTIAPSQPQSAFSLLSSIASTLQNAGSTSAAVTSQALNQDLSSLAQYQQTVVTAQAQAGVTLQSLTSTTSNNSTQETALQTSVSNATSVNMPAALTSLNENLTAVQAAMKAFSSVQSLSLFNYISG
ncbi:flagellar hook-associated protein FlgL [Acidocella sp.]|jgi:flagellar hook-associated protein 3 FlgL|uniref:flagellar hook-associated protein FlgL n=1 Tax=Acidocella sp. TaxID=50710 RepID=UPI002F405A50